MEIAVVKLDFLVVLISDQIQFLLSAVCSK